MRNIRGSSKVEEGVVLLLTGDGGGDEGVRVILSEFLGEVGRHVAEDDVEADGVEHCGAEGDEQGAGLAEDLQQRSVLRSGACFLVRRGPTLVEWTPDLAGPVPHERMSP